MGGGSSRDSGKRRLSKAQASNAAPGVSSEQVAAQATRVSDNEIAQVGDSVPNREVGNSAPNREVDSESSRIQVSRELQPGSAMATVKQVVSDAEASFTFEGLKNMVVGSFKLSEAELRQLFEEVDTDNDGLVTKEQFLDGLSATPSVGGLRGISGVLRDAGVLELLAEETLAALKRRIGVSGHDVDMATILRQANAGDIRDGLQAAQDAIVNAVANNLSRMQGKPSSVSSTQSFNDKFAYDNSTFEGVYLDVEEFRDGVEGALGLPGKDIYAGMEMEFCFSGDSQKVFSSSNYGISTTPEKEWRFVLAPDMGEDSRQALRKPVPLRILLLACSAKRANESEERYDAVLEEMSEAERDGVKTVLLRRVKEAGLTTAFLSAAAASDERLQRLGELGDTGLARLRARLTHVLHDTPCSPATGHPAFASVVAALEEGEGGVTLAEAEGLVAAMRCKVAEAGLNEEEVIALRLYTGPAFQKLNGTLRGIEEGLYGNNYVATIFAAISGMAKLASISPIPAGRTVYRGQKGMRLPASFWKGNAQGVKGGVEMAFLSTTSDFKVASQYAAGGALPTVFAIQVGAVDKGAALGFLSQFPDEEEILMPPRSFLEVVDEPSLLASDEGVVLSIPVRINCNLLCPTLEKLRESRKTMLVSTLEHMRKEIARDVDALLKSDAVKQRAKADIFWKYPARRREFAASIKQESVKALAAVRAKPAPRYLNDAHFRRAMHQALDLQRIAMGKLQLWLEERKLYIFHLSPLSAQDCERKAAGRIRRLIEDAEERAGAAATEEEAGAARAERKALVGRLCKQMELIEDEGAVDEEIETSGGETSLMLAAAAGNPQDGMPEPEREGFWCWQAVRLLLAAGAHANRARADGMTPLILAAQGGHAEVVKMLVEVGGADPDARDKVEGRTALIHSAENGHTETVAALLRECKADPAIAIASGPQAGGDAAYRAAYFGFGKTLRTLVEVGGMDAGAAKDNGWTALMGAAQNGHEAVVQWVVTAAKADVNVRNADGKTALMLAAQQGHAAIVRWLVEEGGADVAAVDKNGSNVMMLAAPKAVDPAMMALLIQDARIDPRATDKKGRTALLIAASNGSAATVQLLAESGAAVGAVDAEGSTALMLAAENGHLKVVEWLLAHSDTDASAGSERRGCTALTLAAEKGRVEVLEALVAARAEVGVRNEHGTTALMAAAGAQQREVVERLLAAAGTEAESADAMGWTAVHYALYSDDEALAHVVLAHSMRAEPDAERQARLAAASKDIDVQLSKPLRVWAGVPWKAWVDAEARTVKFTAFSTVRFDACCAAPARAYYELEVLEPLFCPQFGFATAAFKAVQKRTGKGCGDDAESWGVDGQRKKRFHNAKTRPYPVVWTAGDVVGLACDLRANLILVSVNGDFAEPNGVAYDLKAAEGGEAKGPPEKLFAAFSCSAGRVRFNFGEDPAVAFKFQPPSPDFLPMAHALPVSAGAGAS